MLVNKPAGGFVWVGEVNSLPGEGRVEMRGCREAFLRYPLLKTF